MRDSIYLILGEFHQFKQIMSPADLAPVQEIAHTQTQNEEIHQDSSQEAPDGSNPQLPVDFNSEPPANVGSKCQPPNP